MFGPNPNVKQRRLIRRWMMQPAFVGVVLGGIMFPSWEQDWVHWYPKT